MCPRPAARGERRCPVLSLHVLLKAQQVKLVSVGPDRFAFPLPALCQRLWIALSCINNKAVVRFPGEARAEGEPRGMTSVFLSGTASASAAAPGLGRGRVCAALAGRPDLRRFPCGKPREIPAAAAAGREPPGRAPGRRAARCSAHAPPGPQPLKGACVAAAPGQKRESPWDPGTQGSRRPLVPAVLLWAAASR
nr:atherin-like [Vicugna pacos]